MKRGRYRRAVFIVVYSKVGNKIKYLLLKRKLHWKGWEFPKGGRNFLETELRAVRRETREETGLKILKIKKFNVHGKYKYAREYNDRKGIIGQTYSLYSAEVKKGKVRLSKKEHSDYKWLGFRKAIKQLAWKNQKRCLKIVNNYLSHAKED